MAVRRGMVGPMRRWCDCSLPRPVSQRVSLKDIEVSFESRRRGRPPWTPALVEKYLRQIIDEEQRKKDAGPQRQTDLKLDDAPGT